MYPVSKTNHPGSTAEEIEKESSSASHHRPGYLHYGHGRPSGFAPQHTGADESIKSGEIDGKKTIRSILEQTTDWKLYDPEKHYGARFVVDCTEADIKNDERWEVNKKAKQKQEEQERKEQEEMKGKDSEDDGSQGKKQKSEGGHGENDKDQNDSDEHDPKKRKSHSARPEAKSDKYSAHDQHLLDSLKMESEHMASLKPNNGKVKAPRQARKMLSIQASDTNSPDNWIPRSDHLIRLTGAHPLNAESDLNSLFDAGLVTPSYLHYVRNHGAVPHLLWEAHKLSVKSFQEEKEYSMADLDAMDHINIQVALACDGNRRKELNLIRRSKGFNWGAGGVSCAFWKGVPLYSLLPKLTSRPDGVHWHVNFEGADELSEGRYATSIPFELAADPTCDVLLALYMNDVSILPDHGYPVRLIIPGFVGGRCVKWLRRIWLSEEPNSSHYHVWDNRVLPTFITEKDGDFAETMFRHPDTACNEQNLQSVITKPAHGEKLDLERKVYRLQGYAYEGGGHKVEKVEASLDGGKTWLYCVRQFPDYPIRHGNKYWTWIYWYVDVSVQHLMRASELTCRAWNVFKNTQPEQPTWNLMGMMNNCYYRVRPILEGGDVVFRHPVQPATDDSGWQQPSIEVQLTAAKEEAAGPDKQFTKEEIEKHNSKSSCWLVINEKVVDATSVLDWHPGGAHAILGHGGKVHQQTTEEYSSIHDSFAIQKMQQCVIGRISEAAAKIMNQEAEKEKRENSKADALLNKNFWVPVQLASKKAVSHDTREYVFEFNYQTPKKFGLEVGQHVYLAFHLKDSMVFREYTPTKIDPLTFVIKTYFPNQQAPGGTMSNILDMLSIGERVDMRGPIGDIVYKSEGEFRIEDKSFHFKKLNLVAGGTGITPMYQLIKAILPEKTDVKITLILANKNEDDILLRKELVEWADKYQERFVLCNVLSHPSDDWKGEKGHVDERIIKSTMYPPDKDTAVFVCGPPPLIMKAVMPVVKGMFSPLYANHRLGIQGRRKHFWFLMT